MAGLEYKDSSVVSLQYGTREADGGSWMVRKVFTWYGLDLLICFNTQLTSGRYATLFPEYLHLVGSPNYSNRNRFIQLDNAVLH